MIFYIKNRQREGGGMSVFIQNNIVWLVPVASILLTVVIKIAAKPEFVTLGFTDYLDFGFDLSITSMIVLLTGIKGENDAGIWLLFLSFLLIVITSIIVNRVGWEKDTKEQKLIGVLLPDIIGIILLIVATLYMGGIIK